MTDDHAQLILNQSWLPFISYVGISGMPGLVEAGNVLRSETSIKLSIRLPPNLDPKPAIKELEETVLRDPPYDAHVTCTLDKAQGGWGCPPMQPWLEQAVQHSSNIYYQNSAVRSGEGGSIPFMGMLGEKFPNTQFVVTGVLGPGSNAHGPNEFLEVSMAQKLTCCVAHILHAHHNHRSHQN